MNATDAANNLAINWGQTTLGVTYQIEEKNSIISVPGHTTVKKYA